MENSKGEDQRERIERRGSVERRREREEEDNRMKGKRREKTVVPHPGGVRGQIK
jgi:hypothetical protein